MTKKMKVTITNLQTGKETVSYHPKGSKSKKDWFADFQKENPLFAVVNMANNPLHEAMIRAKDILSIAKLPFAEINSTISEIQRLHDYTHTTIKNLIEPPKLLELFREIQNDAREYLKQNKQKQRHSTKARYFQSKLKEALKMSNQVLGLICYFAGAYTTKELKKILILLEININETVIKAIQKYRNNAVNIFRHIDKSNMSVREINAKITNIECAYIIMKEKEIKGKTKARTAKKQIENMISYL